MMMTALIVDDEPLARSRLRRLLEGQDIEIKGEAQNGATALQLAEDLHPDLLFLDIRMPGLTGMQIASAIAHLDSPPVVVFVTGYSEHALPAFEHGALDYLVKPVSADRLMVTLARARERLSDRRARAEAQRSAIEQAGALPRLRSLPVRGDYAVKFIALDKILCILARDKKVFARTDTGEFRTFYTLTQLESLLPPDRFLRIHDSAVANLDAIVELSFLGDHAYEARLTNGERLRVGRTRYADLQRHLGLDRRTTA
jgi:DNA-binding LytR/AlgR family response regulator